MRIFMIFTCETWFHPLFPYFAYFHMWKQIFFTCVSHVYCMQFTCEILHPFTCEKWSLHVMGHISHENVSWSHVNRMWKTGVRMRKIRMRTACEILTRTDEFEAHPGCENRSIAFWLVENIIVYHNFDSFFILKRIFLF